MRLTRIHCSTTLDEGESAVVTGSAAQHLRRVLRARPGDKVVLFDGSGNEYHAVIPQELSQQHQPRIHHAEPAVVPVQRFAFLAHDLA